LMIFLNGNGEITILPSIQSSDWYSGYTKSIEDDA